MKVELTKKPDRETIKFIPYILLYLIIHTNMYKYIYIFLWLEKRRGMRWDG